MAETKKAKNLAESFNSLPPASRQIILDLADLLEEENDLQAQISQRPPHSNGFVLLPMGPTSYNKGDDDADEEIRNNLQGELNVVRQKIKDNISKAFIVGLGDFKQIQKLCKERGMKP